ncbi:MAG: GyrI-like domain-containing protein, partial [Ruminococcus sp.]|nr:GyrI-like domain-containing protein [Ruminococcus sp.]
QWVAMIRLPDFITKTDFEWAVETAAKKKKLDCSKADYFTLNEGLCVQMMHIGSYDDEPASVEMMNRFIAEQGYVNDICEERQHHEIYLSDPRKNEPAKLKTVIRHPIKKG